MTILIIAEHDNSQLQAATLNTITAAMHIGGDIHILVAGHQCQAVAEQAARLRGVRCIKLADAAHYASPLAENLTALVVPLAEQYSHILAPATSFGKNLLPRIAALLDVAQISEITEVISTDTFVRPIYAGNALATVQSIDPIKVITVRTSAFAPTTEEGNATIEIIPAGEASGLTRFVEHTLTVSVRPELGVAKVVVSGGRGLGNADNFQNHLLPLAKKLNAAVGASRAAVDAGYVSNDYQVGQTGTIVAPDLYIAVGISGAIQHIAGMKDSKVIVAINKDPDAPIFQVADYGLVADLFDAVPQLTAAL